MKKQLFAAVVVLGLAGFTSTAGLEERQHGFDAEVTYWVSGCLFGTQAVPAVDLPPDHPSQCWPVAMERWAVDPTPPLFPGQPWGLVRRTVRVL